MQVYAAGVGPWDAWVRSGRSVLPQPLPLTLGSDVSGVVVEVGDDVHDFEVGQQVFGVTNKRFIGAYAEYAAMRAAMIAHKPASFDHLHCSGIPVVSVTAQRNRLILLGLMSAAGWDFYAKEWWHYQLSEARRYPLLSDTILPIPMMPR